MATLVGIDIGKTHIRMALLKTSYRKFAIQRLGEVALADFEDHTAALAVLLNGLQKEIESVATAVDGESSFIHRLKLPATAAKQIAEVLPFELEAQVPVDFDEVVYDYRVQPRKGGTDPVYVLAAVSRISQVRDTIDAVKLAAGREPERIGCGPLSLANLAGFSPALSEVGPVAVIDLGARQSEVVLLQSGQPVAGRTLSRGVEGLPASAEALAAELRRTIMAWTAQGGAPVTAVHMVGGGASAPGAAEYLTHALGVPVAPLPALELDVAEPDYLAQTPRFAKAIALAAGLRGRPRDPDLRQGPLGFQRGYGFLREKLPLLSGLAAAIFISFMFSTWAELRALDREAEVLSTALASLSKEVLDEETSDPERVMDLVDKGPGKKEQDPMPKVDAFDVIVELSKSIPTSVTHDIREFDMQRGKVKVQGVVGSTDEAQSIATVMNEKECFSGAKINKVTQAIGSSRQNYVLEFDVDCDKAKDAKKKKSGGAKAGDK